MIDITKVILLIISIVSFVGLILYVVKAFKSTCPEKTHYSKELSQCVQDCDPPQINDIDGSCVCPNKTDQYVGGQCIPTCPKDRPKLCSGPNQCYSDEQQTCLNDKILCDIEQVCGDDNCCKPENGQPTTCSNGNIIFKSSDSFSVIEGNSINTTITIKAGTYSTTDSDIDSYYPTVLSKLLTSASELTSNKYTYTCTFDGTKLVFTVSNKDGFQPTFNFIYGTTNDASKFGFDFTSHSFTNNTLTSDSLNTNYCYVTECPSGQEVCGDEGCCDKDSCVVNNGVSTCCDKKFTKICGTAPNGTCCPKDQECCGNVCCPDGEICGKDGKCKIACDLPDKDGKKLYCDPNTKDGKEGDFCVLIGDKQTPGSYGYCGHNDCIVKDFKYNPVDLYGPNPLAKIVLPVCSGSDGKLYSGNYSLNSGNKLSRDLPMEFNKGLSTLCTKNDCMQLYKYHGIKELTPNDDGCYATFDCLQILNENDKEYSNKCPFGDGSTQCVYDSLGNFTGQVCPDTTFAYRSDSGVDCIKGWTSSDIPSPGHGTKCVPVTGLETIHPSKIYSRKCISTDDANADCCRDSCVRGFIGDKCDQVIYNNEQVKTLLNNMPYIVQQYSGKFENLFNALSDQKFEYLLNSPYTYILVYCVNEAGGRYYNYCANNSKNYWTEDTIITGFYNTLGQDIGDLVWNTDGVGFWWNTDTCNNPPTGGNTRYISVNSDGTLRGESALGSNVKFFPNVYVREMDQESTGAGTLKTYKTLGVLLIYGP